MASSALNDSISMSLTPDEVCLACLHGLMRRMAKFRGERGDRAQAKRSSWENELEGACAEVAYCKLHGVFWAGLSELRSTDAGHEEVRWTCHEHTGHLIIYTHDDDEKRYVLMDGFAPKFRVVGWLRGGEGKQDKWWAQKYGFFMVPREALYSPLEL